MGKAAQLPSDLYGRETLVLRPRDLASRYARPTKELRRLAARGVLRPIAHGYYLLPPADRLSDPRWRPEVEALALALAIADYGVEEVTLMGLSAARSHGAWPRALAVAVVAVPRQRPPLSTPYGRLVFVERDTARLEVQPVATALATGLVTTIEQTVLDLADRPALGEATGQEVGEAIAALSVRADWDETLALARRQRLHAAYLRALWVAAAVLDESPPPWPARRPVPGIGLLPPGPRDAALGIVNAHAGT